MTVYKTVFLDKGSFYSSHMNERTFTNPWLKQEYMLNVETRYLGWGFPLYAWKTLAVAKRARDRYSNLYIFKCTAHLYYGDSIYNVSKDSSLLLLKNSYYKNQFLAKLSEISIEVQMVLCTSITPLCCVG